MSVLEAMLGHFIKDNIRYQNIDLAIEIFIDREAREIMYLVASVHPSVCVCAGWGRPFGVSRTGKKGQNIFRKRAISGTKQGHKNQM